MASGMPDFVTAIRDTEFESFIAAGAINLGWNVLFRATDFQGLSRYLKDHPDHFLIASDDFDCISEISCNQQLLLKSSPLMDSPGSYDKPETESDLHQLVLSLIHSRSELSAPEFHLNSNVIVFASIGRRLGTTTLALNYASEIAALGYKVLLIDAHLTHPSIASVVDLHGARKTIIEIDKYLSVVEVNSSSMLRVIEGASAEFEFIIIDLGELLLNEKVIIGLRLQDSLTRVSLKSAQHCNLIIEENRFAQGDLLSRLPQLKKFSENSTIRIHTMCEFPLSGKEREKFVQGIEESFGLKAIPLIRDHRAISSQSKKFSPLRYSAAKSNLRRQIERLSREQLQLVDKREG